MEMMIAFCGLDCAGCEAYKATQANDQEAKQAVLEKWRIEFNTPEMTLASVTCDSCTSSGRLWGYCHDCPVRACAIAKDVMNCAYCDNYESCETLQTFIADVPDAGKNLAAIRASF